MGCVAEALEDRLEGGADDGLGEGARGVVRAGAAALVAWAGGRSRPCGTMSGVACGRRFLPRAATQRRPGVAAAFERVGGRAGERRSRPRPSAASRGRAGLAARSASRSTSTRTCVGLDGDRGALGDAQLEAHHGLVDRADLLDVEGAVGDALAVEDEEVLEDAVDDAVGDAAAARCARAVDAGRRTGGPRGSPRCRGRRGGRGGPAGAGRRGCAPSWIRRKSVRSCAQAP